MRIPRVFIDSELEHKTELTLNENQSHYLLKVLRLKRNFQLVVFNGNGHDYMAQIKSTDKKSAVILLQEKMPAEQPPAIYIHLALGISKGDRFDTAIQKATELGVSEITPLITEHNAVKLSTERLQKKNEHWQSIIRSACEQSQRGYLPILNNTASLENWSVQDDFGQQLILQPGSDKNFKELQPAPRILLLIGPEGGLSEQEVSQALHNGFTGVRFGRHILRTETAAIAAVTAIQTLWGW